MSPDRETRVVGRCSECGRTILEVVRVTPTRPQSLSLDVQVIRRCGCGEWQALDPETPPPGNNTCQ